MDIVTQAWQWLQAMAAGIWLWFTQLPWGQWFVSLMTMTLVEWVGFLASIAALIAFAIGIPRLWSFQYTQRYRVFVELYKINAHLISRLLSNDVSTATTYREALRDNIHANSYEFSSKDNTYIYDQWKKANKQVNKLLESGTKVNSEADIPDLTELRERLHREIQKLRKAPINMSE